MVVCVCCASVRWGSETVQLPVGSVSHSSTSPTTYCNIQCNTFVQHFDLDFATNSNVFHCPLLEHSTIIPVYLSPDSPHTSETLRSIPSMLWDLFYLSLRLGLGYDWWSTHTRQAFHRRVSLPYVQPWSGEPPGNRKDVRPLANPNLVDLIMPRSQSC